MSGSGILTGNKTKFTFKIQGSSSKTGVLDMCVDEAMSTPFRADLSIVSEDEIPLESVLEKEGLLTVDGAHSDRYIHGVISTFERVAEGERFITYKATLVPRIWFLGLRKDNRIFQNKTVREIITEVLEAAQIKGSDRVEFRLEGTYKPMEYCTQYRETDLAFLSRLLEHEGIYYFFEHTDKTHKIVFADGKSAYKPLNSVEELLFKEAGMVAGDESVLAFTCRKKVKPGKLTLNDFNPAQPSTPMNKQQEGTVHKNLEEYLYPGNYEDASTGQRLTNIRLQERLVTQELGQGTSNSPALTPGFTFSLEAHPNSSCNKKYFIISTTHAGTQPQVLEGSAEGSEGYTVRFSVIPADVIYRPERTIQKPIMYGPQTAIVTGPKGEEIYTDDHGRIKVQFHWDRQGKKDEKSSCWIRVSQNSAGEGWGSMYVPRIGQEVIVSFIDGDPDKPIITGRVYNGANPPPHGLPANKTKSTIMSQSTPGGGGANELSFEDKKGEEEVYLHGQKDLTVKIENDKNQTVGNNETHSVGANRSTTVTSNETISVGGMKNETVGKASNESVLMAKTVNVGGAHLLNIGGANTVTVAGAMNTAVGGAHADEVGLARNTVVKKAYKIQAGESFEVSCGSSKFVMKKDGSIQISGKKISIEASGSIKINGKDVDIN